MSNNRIIKRFWNSKIFENIDACVNAQCGAWSWLNCPFEFNIIVKEKFYKNEDWYFISEDVFISPRNVKQEILPTRSGKIIVPETDINYFVECIENKTLRDKLFIMLKLQYGPQYQKYVRFIGKLYRGIAKHRKEELDSLMGT